MSEQKTYLSKVSEEEEGFVVDVPPALFEELSWKDGDILVWAALPDGKGFVVTTMDDINGA